MRFQFATSRRPWWRWWVGYSSRDACFVLLSTICSSIHHEESAEVMERRGDWSQPKTCNLLLGQGCLWIRMSINKYGKTGCKASWIWNAFWGILQFGYRTHKLSKVRFGCMIYWLDCLMGTPRCGSTADRLTKSHKFDRRPKTGAILTWIKYLWCAIRRLYPFADLWKLTD